MIVMIDNYDSFTFNLVRYAQELGETVVVYRHDAVTIAEIEALNPDHIMISPGPCSPQEAGISNEVIRHFAGRIPILGICLGHQCIGHVFGRKVIRAIKPIHGKVSYIHHGGTGLFRRLPQPLRVTRYHSLVVSQAEHTNLTAGDALDITATTEGGEIMALAHRTLPIVGVQFHPEAVLTEGGHQLLQNFLMGHYR